MKVTLEEFRNAMVVVETYTHQIEEAKIIAKYPHMPGCRVRLSDYGLDIDGKRFKKRVGTVIDYSPWICNPTTDGMVTVKWDDVKKPDFRHVSQVESIKRTKNANR